MSRRGRVWQEGRAKDEPAIRGAKWFYVVDLAAPGQPRRQVKKRGFATKEDAENALAVLLGEVRDGTRVEPSKQTFGGFMQQWLDALPTSGRRESTIFSYRQVITGNVLKQPIAQVPLQALTPIDLDQLYAHLITAGGRKGDGLGLRSVRLVHTIISKALSDAKRKGAIKSNPALDASAPSAKSTKAPEFSVWTPAELRTFLLLADGSIAAPGQTTKLRPSPHAMLFRLGGMTGMRRGELCGLRWIDVDLDQATVKVRHTLMVVGGKVVEGIPKTENGRRTIDLDEVTVAALRAHRKVQLEQRMLMGAGYTDHGYVFAQVDGRPYFPNGISEVFDRLVKRSGLPRIRLHDLRHTHATHLLAAGVNVKVVSERLGHSSASMTLDVYSHVLAGQQAQAAAAVAALVAGVGT